MQSKSEKTASPFLIRSLYLAVLVLAIPLLAWNGIVSQINAGLTDVLSRLPARASMPAVETIVLLAIDDGTLARYGPLPLKRSTLAAGLNRLAPFRPRVLAIDMLLSEARQPDEDQELSRALDAFPDAILSGALVGDVGAQPGWILPLPVFAESHELAHVHAEPDPDGNVRSVLLIKAAGTRRLWALGLQAARLAARAGQPLETRNSVDVGTIRIPAPESSDRAMAIHYAGPEGTFRRVPFWSLLDGTARADAFRDKIVFLGVTAQAGGDRLFTPVSAGAGTGMSGIEIHANVARTILDRAFLVPLSVPGEVAAFVVIAMACVLGAGALRGMRLFAALTAIAAAIAAGCVAALRFGQVWPPGSLLAVFLASAGISIAGEYAAMALGLRASERKRRDYAFRVQAIAHEIKTPLTAIQGSSEVISDQLIPDDQRVLMAGMIHKESKRLTEIIHAFLDVERMASGSLSIDKRPTAIDTVCGEVLERARLYAVRKKIRITSDVPHVVVPADADLLSFAIYNLLTNAVKYSAKQTSISLGVTEQSDTVSIAVTDQGYGIAPADQKRIFERFYRVTRDKSGVEEGNGIGLALVNEIAVQHGGRVDVDSKEGAGSRFTVVLPKSSK